MSARHPIVIDESVESLARENVYSAQTERKNQVQPSARPKERIVHQSSGARSQVKMAPASSGSYLKPPLARSKSMMDFPKKSSQRASIQEKNITYRASTHHERNREVSGSVRGRPNQKAAATVKSNSKKPLLETKCAEPLGVDCMERTWIAYECSCCYNDVRFEYLVQCNEGHLFCIECLQRFAHEAVYGSGMKTMKCLADGCSSIFAESQLVRALPDSLKAKLEERIQEEEISVASLENFIRCSFCNFGAQVDVGQQFFHCANPACLKVTCKICQVEFLEHKGLQCNEIEKESEIKVRREYEEKMTAAKIRQCPQCNAKFTKEEGCNKITCRCGTFMCYVCRSRISCYKHFCQHIRSPGKPCSFCVKCKLYTNCNEDDDIAIKELKVVAQKARLDLGFQEEREIGAPLTKMNK